MPNEKRNLQMLVPTLVMAALAAVLLFVGYQKGQGQHIASLKSALVMLVQLLPLLICAFIVANMIQTLIPRESIARWIGGQSGLQGLLLGSIAGGLSPGGPYVNMPIALALMRAGASIGVMVSFLTGWSLLAIARLPLEIGILGWRFMLVRLACVFFFPPIAGFIAQTLFSGLKL